MFTQLGGWLDQLIRETPPLVHDNGFAIAWTCVALYAVRTFMRWGMPY